MRFREQKVGVSADIEKAFLQISIHADDRQYLKFFWWRDGSVEEMITFRHARVVFSIKSSPFLLGAVLNHHINRHLRKESGRPKQMLSLLKEGFYVDNLVTSVESLEDAKEFRRLSCVVMKDGGFNLREWEFTDVQAPNEGSTILGIKWYRNTDTLGVNLDWLKEEIKFVKFTKRTVLSISQRIFDPIGFSVPALMQLKLLAQRLWEKKLDWDDPLEESDRKFLEDWLNSLHLLGSITINRCLGTGRNLTLHVFCDASKKAYASVVFARSEVGEDVVVELIQAKARVAPLKELSIPRLELLAATIGARLVTAVQDALRWKDVPVYVWTDSTTVLAWVLRQEEWSVFVRNRVKEIRDLTGSATWRHLPGDLNPADLPSRGCGIKFLVGSKWWEGPLWLKSKQEEWPSTSCCYEEEQILKEMLKKSTTLVTLAPEVQDYNWLDHSFERFEKIVRMVGWIVRFIDNCKDRLVKRDEIKRFSDDGPEKVGPAMRKGPLSVNELDNAENLVFRIIQEESFPSISDVRINHLHPFKDSLGVIRIKTKILEREDELEFRTPVLLPAKHPLVQKLLFDLHLKSRHIGPQTLLSKAREKFWILKGRQVARKVVKSCKTCKRYEGKNFDVCSPPLPEARVCGGPVFGVVGVDFAGPLYLRGGEKVWICLFTCANYRAIHMEIVSSLKTESFILALRRFIARRGRPKIIYSDNGTNFHGANNAFAEVDWKEIYEHCSVERMEWRFNPPSAPWWGGFWERLIGLVKRLLRRTLGRAVLDLENLYTVVCDCEAQINARPLTYIAETNADPVPLTPAMFLQDIQQVGVPECDVIESIDLCRRLRYRQCLKNQLRERFRAEYLGQLSWERRKSTREPTVGEVVLLESGNAKRMDWPLAVVEEVFRGRDGQIRVLRLRTQKGLLDRPLQRVYPLEVEPSEMKAVLTDTCNSEEIAGQDVRTTRSGRAVIAPRRFND